MPSATKSGAYTRFDSYYHFWAHQTSTLFRRFLRLQIYEEGYVATPCHVTRRLTRVLPIVPRIYYDMQREGHAILANPITTLYLANHDAWPKAS